MGLSTLKLNNIVDFKFELITFFLVSIIGIFCIIYYFMHNSDKEFYKVAFVAILCFGIICSFIVPIMDVSDEVEHLARAEITSQGIIIPHWTGHDVGLSSSFNITKNGEKIFNGVGFETIESMNFYDQNREITVFQTTHDTDKINHSKVIFMSAFEQNPFYAYLPQAIGVFIAKLLDLSLIWMMWLGRIFNLVFYAALVSFAIKKTPNLKMPLFAVACIPLAIYQAASISIDSTIISLGILAVAYFIYMCKSVNLDWKNIFIFSAICLLMGLCKLPFLTFIFLLFFIPKENFNENKKNILAYMIIGVLIVSIIGFLWSNYSAPALLHSWRPLESNANSTQQIHFLMNHPDGILKFFTQIFTTELLILSNGVFNFFNGTPGIHYADNYFIITPILQLFLIVVLCLYPEDIDFNRNTKLGALGILLLTYVGTCFVQLLSWSSVGGFNLGISLRYFIPLLALVPIFCRFKLNIFDKKDFDKYAFCFIIAFLAVLIFAFATKYY